VRPLEKLATAHRAADAEPVAVEVEEILVLHHSHLDVGYTHSQPIVWRLQKEFITEAIDWLEATSVLPEAARPKWTCEVTEPLRRWLDDASDESIERFTQLHRAGRIGIAALRWHIDSCVDMRGLERLLTGKRELEDLLETTLRVACQHDVNGVPWPLADVLLDAGVDFFTMAVNPHLGRAVQPRPGMFRWQAPSGRQLRVFNGSAYTMFDQAFFAWEDSVERMEDGWARLARRLGEIGYPLPFVYLTSTCSPTLWDNSPPNPFLPGLVQRWNESGCLPPIRHATLDDLRERAMDVPDDALPILRGDWTDYWSFGCGSVPVETALNKRSRTLLAAAAALSDGSDTDLLHDASAAVDLYDEHTFGYWDTADEHPQTQTIELLARALAHEGHELVSLALMDGLERLAENPRVDGAVSSVLFCNPSSYSVTLFPELPAEWFEASGRSYRARRLAYDGRSWANAYPGPDAHRFGCIDIPPRSWTTIPLDELPASEPDAELVERREPLADDGHEPIRGFAAAAAAHRRRGTIETPHYVFSYDADSGRILSLVDRQAGRELFSGTDGLDFFSFVRERPNGLTEPSRLAFYRRDLERESVDESCWQDWHAVREGATRVRRCEVTRGDAWITFERELEGPGVRHLVERVTFRSADRIVELALDLDLEPDGSPYAVYFAFPLAMSAGWRALFDTAGQAVFLDEDQLPGACRNWVTTESVAAIGTDDCAVALLSPVAPLVQFGGFHFGPPLGAVPRDENPLLLSWVYNNYWETNFPRVRHGRIRLRYGFVALPRLDAGVALDYASRFRQPSLIWPVTAGGRLRGGGSLA
jgi:alpha-mannosidase